jgi:hypothetical protein
MVLELSPARQHLPSMGKTLDWTCSTTEQGKSVCWAGVMAQVAECAPSKWEAQDHQKRKEISNEKGI